MDTKRELGWSNIKNKQKYYNVWIKQMKGGGILALMAELELLTIANEEQTLTAPSSTSLFRNESHIKLHSFNMSNNYWLNLTTASKILSHNL